MAIVTANTKVNFDSYTPLAIFADGDVEYTNRSANHFVASLGDVDVVVDGSGINTVGEPVTGAVLDILVFIDNVINCDFEVVLNTSTLTNGNASATLSSILVSDDELTGSNKGDTLRGFQGDDLIKGGKGNDILDGGSASTDGNTLIGGKGGDAFRFTSGAFNTIKDFGSRDELHFENANFAFLGSEGKLKAKFFRAGKEAKDDNDLVIYDKGTGKLFIDVDGEGGTDQFFIARLSGKPNVDNDDIFVI